MCMARRMSTIIHGIRTFSQRTFSQRTLSQRTFSQRTFSQYLQGGHLANIQNFHLTSTCIFCYIPTIHVDIHPW